MHESDVWLNEPLTHHAARPFKRRRISCESIVCCDPSCLSLCSHDCLPACDQDCISVCSDNNCSQDCQEICPETCPEIIFDPCTESCTVDCENPCKNDCPDFCQDPCLADCSGSCPTIYQTNDYHSELTYSNNSYFHDLHDLHESHDLHNLQDYQNAMPQDVSPAEAKTLELVQRSSEEREQPAKPKKGQPPIEREFRCHCLDPETKQKCNFLFTNVASVEGHLKAKHTKDLVPHPTAKARFFCPWSGCPQTTSKSHLLRHVIGAHKTPGYECPNQPHGCQANHFSTKQQLDYHFNSTHATKKWIKCTEPNCPYEYQDGKTNNLKEHMQRAHSGKVHLCKHCMIRWNDRSNFNHHLQQNHERGVECPACGSKHRTVDTMKTHLEKAKKNPEMGDHSSFVFDDDETLKNWFDNESDILLNTQVGYREWFDAQQLARETKALKNAQNKENKKQNSPPGSQTQKKRKASEAFETEEEEEEEDSVDGGPRVGHGMHGFGEAEEEEEDLMAGGPRVDQRDYAAELALMLALQRARTPIGR